MKYRVTVDVGSPSNWVSAYSDKAEADKVFDNIRDAWARGDLCMETEHENGARGLVFLSAVRSVMLTVEEEDAK